MTTQRGPMRVPGRFPQALIDAILDDMADEIRDAEPQDITVCDEHSNDMAEISFSDGRTLMVKRGYEAWAAERFDTSRLAARLLRERTGIEVPAHIPLRRNPDERALLAYWRIQLPTLKELWPEIPRLERPKVLRSWGELIRRIHEARLPGHGPLARATHTSSPLSAFLEEDLEGRLLPAVAGVWPAGLDALRSLIEAAPEIAAGADFDAVLCHNDMHMANVLCEAEGDDVRCVGVLDLEAAIAGPPEVDLAVAQVLHGPLFSQPLEEPWVEPLLEGHGPPPDPRLLAFFRAYHLLNLGFYAALLGHAWHADEVACAARREARETGRLAMPRGMLQKPKLKREIHELVPDSLPRH